LLEGESDAARMGGTVTYKFPLRLG
jgi:hypothetical protein